MTAAPDLPPSPATPPPTPATPPPLLPAQPPATPAKPGFRFTKENARLFAVKGQASNRLRLATEKAQREASVEHARKIKLAAELEKLNAPSSASIVDDEIQRIGKQLAGKLTPGERAALVKALDSMLDRQRILAGVALPGRTPAPRVDAEPQGSSRLLGSPVSPAPGQRTGRDDQE